MVTPLQYHSGISLEEARERLEEVNGAYEDVKRRYSGWASKLLRRMRKEDQRALAECIGVLLPLSLEDSVQREVQEAQNPKGTVWQKAGTLNYRIMDYLADFRNTRTKRIG